MCRHGPVIEQCTDCVVFPLTALPRSLIGLNGDLLLTERKGSLRQIFQIGTVRYAESQRRMRRHGPVIVLCSDSENFPSLLLRDVRRGRKGNDLVPSVKIH